ncbi:hypothetical protein LE191_08595 [Janthinobacterium sp. HSC-3S05]|nr:hypothetical protein [Janthinobacterium lividum]
MQELEKFVAEVNSLAASVEFDATNSTSIEAAMGVADQHVDQVAGRYNRNPLLKEVAQKVKIQLRERILEQAANSRLENNDEADMTQSNDVREYLNEIAEIALELQSSDYQTIQRPMKTLARLLRSDMVGALVTQLTDHIDLDAWLEAGTETQGSMVGSAILSWPDSIEAELGTTILLINRMAEDADFVQNFSFTFYFSGNNYTSTIRKMVGGLIVPFERKFARYVKTKLQVSSSYSPQSAIMNNITITNSQVGVVQTGDFNVAHVEMTVSQNHMQLSESLFKLAEQLKSVEAIPGHDKSEIIELIEDSRSELKKEKPSKAKLSALLPMIGTAVSLVSDLGGAYAAVQTAALLAGFPF